MTDLGLATLRVMHRTGEPPDRASSAFGARRASLVITAGDGCGTVGVGEATPWGTTSTLAADRQTIAAIAVGDLSHCQSFSDIARALTPLPLSSAARFGVETALLDLLAKRRDCPMHALLGPVDPRPVPVNAVVTTLDIDQAVEGAERARQGGITTLKLKIGRPNQFSNELELIDELTRQVPGLTIRVDANRRLSGQHLVRDLDALARRGLEFVEEAAPLVELAALSELPVAIAIDESMTDPASLPLIDHPSIAAALCAVVVKPTMHGGIAGCLELDQLAREGDLDLIVTHSFDGPIALAAACELALALAPRRPCGLAKHQGLECWPAADLGQLHAGFIAPGTAAGHGVRANIMGVGE